MTPSGNEGYSNTPRLSAEDVHDVPSALIEKPEGLASAKYPVNAQGLRLDGPTLDEFVAAGYKAEYYPPAGYADLRPVNTDALPATEPLPEQVAPVGDVASAPPPVDLPPATA